MSRTIHALDAPANGEFGKHLLCICKEEDDPNCPALNTFKAAQQEEQHQGSTLSFLAREALRNAVPPILPLGPDDFGGSDFEPQVDPMHDRPRSAVEIAMAQTADTDPYARERALDQRAMTRTNKDGASVPDLRSPAAVAVGSNPFVQKREALQREMVSSKYTMRRRGRMIPERGRMVVARVEWDEKIGSIFILDGHRKQLEQSNQEAVIMACGPLRIDPATGKEVPMRFSIQEAIGKHIVIREHSGIEFVTHDENGKEIICYWIGQSEVWGWLEPYPGDEANSPEIWKAIAYLGEETAPQKAAAPETNVCPLLCYLRDCPNLCANMHSTAEGHLCLEHLPI